MGALSKIRKQFLTRQHAEESQAKQLDEKTLREVWDVFTRKLRENKHSATQSFQSAGLKIIDPAKFEVITPNNLEQKFIEQEKRSLSDFVQQAFNNKSISFQILIDETKQSTSIGEKHLSKREQFQQLIEQYPLVKELKDRLRLELDY
jgi:DNA polymerase-3 subunit gamma/tau